MNETSGLGSNSKTCYVHKVCVHGERLAVVRPLSGRWGLLSAGRLRSTLRATSWMRHALSRHEASPHPDGHGFVVWSASGTGDVIATITGISYTLIR